MAAKEAYRGHGALGVLAHLAESKLVFPEEYELLRSAVTQKDKPLPGADQVLERLLGHADGSYRAEDLFALIGLLAEACTRSEEVGLRQIKLSGALAKLPFGTPGRSLARWKSRFFRLQGNGLSYFAKENDAKPKGQLVLTPSSNVRDSAASSRSQCFDVVTKNGTLCLSANSENEKELWVCAIARAIHGSRAGPAALQSALAPSISMADGDISRFNEDTAYARKHESGPQHASTRRLPTAEQAEPNQRAGPLLKLAIKSRRNWKVRHFVLYRNLLSYFESAEEKRAKRDIILDSACKVNLGLPKGVDPATLPEGSDAEACFHLLTDAKAVPLVLAAASLDQRDAWVSAIETAVELSDNLLFSGVFDAAGPPAPALAPGTAGTAPSAAPAVVAEVLLARSTCRNAVATSIGVLTLAPTDTLLSLRARIFNELESVELPVDFSFLRKVTRPMRSGVPVAKSEGVFDRFLANDYAKVNRDQEEYFGVDKVQEDDDRIVLLAVAEEGPSHAPAPTATATAAAAVAKAKQASAASSSGESANAGADASAPASAPADGPKALPSDERLKLEREIKRLRSELAAAHNTIAQMRQGGAGMAAAGAGGRTLSPLETRLASLQRDGYVDEELSVRKLAKSYQRLFQAGDISAVLLDAEGPFAPLLRRYAGEPEHIREFMDALQEVLGSCTIPKMRLSQPWWKKKLADVAVLKMGRDALLEWAKSEPWCEDTPERYAYLMGKMKPGAVTPAQTQLLAPRPESGPLDDEDSDSGEEGSAAAGAEEEKEEEEESKSGTTGPPRPAFLQSIQGIGKAQERPSKPAFLQSIQGLGKDGQDPPSKPAFLASIASRGAK